jgi:hypothetical protein
VVVLHVDVAIRVHARRDPDFTLVHELGHVGIRAVVGEQVLGELERQLDAHELARMVAAHDQDLGLRLVRRDVVRDLQRVDLAQLEARADRRQARQTGIRRHEALQGDVHLVVRPVRTEVLVQGGNAVAAARSGQEPRLRTPGEKTALLIGCRHQVQHAFPGDGDDLDAVCVEHFDLCRAFVGDLVERSLGERKTGGERQHDRKHEST